MHNCSQIGEKINGDQCFEKIEKVKPSNLKLEDIRSKISNYLLALRPWSFSASFTPVALGAILAYRTTWEFNFIIFILNLISVFCVHGAGNLINTYYDYVKGIDSSGRSDDRTLVDRRLTPNGVVNLAVILYLFGFTGFMILNLCSPAKIQHLALIFFCGLSSSFLYTGGIGLKYIALGDVIVLIIFGPLSVLFSYLSQTGKWNLITLVYAIPLALNTEAILHSNNTRDMETDRKAGIVTTAILIGLTCSHILLAFLLFVPYMLFTLISFHYSWWFSLPLITLPKAFSIEKEFREGKLQKIPQHTTQLNFCLGIFYLIACTMADFKQMPWLNVT